MPVKKGDKIKVEYTGTLEDGTVFDTTQGKHPLEFEVGSGQIIKGFDNAVTGMEKGQEKEVKLESKDAYGDPNLQLVKKVPRDQLPKGQEPKAGMILGITAPNGMQIPAKIMEVNDKEITIDLNPPLAGKNLNFKIKVIDIVA
jgi:FKBP-type peptidyl-prolyl cis-trans isomerase 2|tara:strand:+ start:891 stop:1319 length:429 start_codon:yes stop_codon:yes gene_type:complete